MKGIKRERIIRILLSHPDGSLTKYRISKMSETSISWTIDYLGSLELRSLLKGTKVIDAVGLFNEWLAISKYPKHFDFFISDPKDLLKDVRLDYALTTYFAENDHSKILFPSRADIYIRKNDFESWRELILKSNGLMGKGNLRLLISEDEYVFDDNVRIKGLTSVSGPQLMLDLLREGGVCLEAFEIMVKRYVR